LYLAFELGKETWKLGFSTGLGQAARIRTVDAGELADLREEIDQAKRRFRLPEETPVKSCYEAGRDGFWLHRYLASLNIANLVVDSASIEVNRRAKRTKTDRLDAAKLLTMLIRYYGGEETVWSVVHVPSIEAEDLRHLHRQLCSLKVSYTRHVCRIGGLLATQGVTLPLHPEFLNSLAAVRLWDGHPLPPGLMARLKREYATLLSVEQEIQDLEKERETLIETSDVPCVGMVDGHRDCLGLAAPPAGQRVEPVVLRSLWRGRQAETQNRRYRSGAQAPGGAMALPGDWGDPCRG